MREVLHHDGNALLLSLNVGKHFRSGLSQSKGPAVDVEAGRCLHGLAGRAPRDAASASRRWSTSTARASCSAAAGAKLYLDLVVAKKQILRA